MIFFWNFHNLFLKGNYIQNKEGKYLVVWHQFTGLIFIKGGNSTRLTSKEMLIHLLQFKSLFVQLFGIFTGSFGNSCSAVLDNIFIFSFQEDNNGIILGIVQFIYIVWSNIQQTMFSLQHKTFTWFYWDQMQIILIYIEVPQWLMINLI